MNEKPIMNCKVAISVAIEQTRYITFWTDANIADKFEQFGNVEQCENETTKYSLSVDGRFDFDEVVAYIGNFDVR